MSLKESALKVVRNTAVRKACVGLVLAIAAALGLGQLGCKDLTPKQQARVDKFECQAAALAPLVGPVMDSTELLHDLYAGRASLPNILKHIDASEDEVDALLKRLGECDNSAAPEPVAPVEA
jgi:hypothetical protein